MSFDAYVNHISQKYSLAIAIAIIRSKPDTKTIEDYIKELKQKVIDQNMELDDLDITLCSDDFNIDDDNDINGDNNRNNNGNPITVEDNDVLMDDTQMTNDSVTILNDFEDINDVRRQKNSDNVKVNEFSDVFRMLTEVDENLQDQQINIFKPNDQIQTDSQITYCDVDLIDNDAIYNSIHFNNTQKRPDNIDKTINQDLDRNSIKNQLAEGTVPNKNIAKDMTRVKSDKILDSNKRDSKIKEVNAIDSQETIIYTLQGLTQNYTHVSQSQNVNFEISDKYIHGIGKFNRNEVNTHFDKTNTTDNKDATNQISSQNEIFTENAQRLDVSVNKKQEVTKTNDCNEIANVLENEQVIEESDTQEELIPFKVIEELSKVKGFFDRKFDRRMSTNSFSTDSGYKTDSQLKSASQQLSGTWVNQSAHSLFNFITVCPLLVNTRDIINEISKVLGELIDKLHEEEKYPSFLEELLESVDLLLRRIYEEDGGSEHELLKKDETVQRLILLSKSVNIQKFLIEKITNILDETYTNLMKDDEQFEIIHVNKIENLSYIFHLLEIVLKGYVKCKDLSSQNSQTSQEEMLKRSSISDIWRKKWNPNNKEIRINEGSVEKKCVLVKCSEVLNKMIVNCMESYSLIAYAALQSFNLLQS